MKTAPAEMSYPNLMSLSLSRGGLSLMEYSTFKFLLLEESFNPTFLNKADFRAAVDALTLNFYIS